MEEVINLVTIFFKIPT